jgi:CpeT protein
LYGQAQADLEAMATMMAGPWTSAELAARDSTYLDIRSVNVRIWQRDPEYSGAWFYTESARPSAPATPYRQNVFNLVAQEDGTVHAYQYRVRAPERFAGAALANRAPEGLTLDDLIALPGCTLVWHREQAGRFVGAMRPRACRNKFRGATWMDGSSWIEPGRFYTWDRGMNDAGEQVWGPTRAGYEFTRAAQ